MFHSCLFVSIRGSSRAAAFLAVMAAATLCGNAPAVWERARVAIREYPSTLGNPFNCGDPVIDERRALVRAHLPAGEPLHLFEPSAKGFTPRLRTIRICLAWEAMPEKLIPFTNETVPGHMDYVATAVYQGERPVADESLVSLGAETDGPVWARRDASAGAVPAPAPVASASPLSELTGLAAPLLVMVMGALWGGWTGLGLGLLAFSVGMGVPPVLGVAPSPVFVLGLVIMIVVSGRWLVVSGGAAPRKNVRVSCRVPSIPSIHSMISIPTTTSNNSMESRESTESKFTNHWPPKTNHLIFCLALALGLFALFAFLALSHTFTSPNGLGVFGGKAKLLYLARGAPEGFFTDAAWAALQPAYPPGFALVTLGCYGLAGGCGEWLTQILPCVFSALACLLFACGCVRHVPAEDGVTVTASVFFALWVTAIFLGAPSLWVTSLYYAEPMMVLLLLAGVDAVLRGRDPVPGWMLVGGCGWVKNEGLLFLPLLWCALRWAEGRERAPVRGLLLGLALPVGWLVWSRLHGATLYDYAPVYLPDIRQVGMAAAETFRLAFLEPWRYGFVFPLACFVPFIPRYRTKRALAGLAVLLGYTLAMWWILGISRASDFEWHLLSLERLLWAPALLALFQMAAGEKRKN